MIYKILANKKARLNGGLSNLLINSLHIGGRLYPKPISMASAIYLPAIYRKLFFPSNNIDGNP
jgi:hypothetical protein